jgi:hypothetical protein
MLAEQLPAAVDSPHCLPLRIVVACMEIDNLASTLLDMRRGGERELRFT